MTVKTHEGNPQSAFGVRGRRQFLGGMAAVGLAASCPAAGEAPIVRFGIISDTHVTGPESIPELNKALEFFRDRSVDGVLHCGDITDLGYISELEAFASAWKSVMPKTTKLIAAMGNRDMSDTSSMPKDDLKTRRAELLLSNSKEVFARVLGIRGGYGMRAEFVNGVPVVVSDWKKENRLESFLGTDVRLRNAAAPAIFIQHLHPRGTVFASSQKEWAMDKGTSTCILNMFPRAVSFSGHSHIPLSTPQSSHKGWFTALSAGSYFLGKGKGGTAREVSVAAVFKDRIEVERRDLNTGFSENLSFSFGRACGEGLAETKAAGEFTFAQWNIGHFAMGRAGDTKIPPTESAAKQAQYEKLLVGIDADFIGLNEYSPKFDLAGKEARDSVFGAYGDFKAGPHYGFNCNAIASKTAPLKAERIGEFSGRKGVRYYIACETEIHGTPFVLVETHLDFSPRENRTAQIAELVRDFAACPRVIISGDFNVDEAGDFAPFAKAGFKQANAGAFGAFPTHRRRKVELTPCIDNVFVKGFDILGAWTGDDSLVLSDHRMLLCRLRPERKG